MKTFSAGFSFARARNKLSANPLCASVSFSSPGDEAPEAGEPAKQRVKANVSPPNQSEFFSFMETILFCIPVHRRDWSASFASSIEMSDFTSGERDSSGGDRRRSDLSKQGLSRFP